MIISKDVIFDEGGMWNWSSKSQKETIVTPNDYEKEAEHVDKTPDDLETSNREDIGDYELDCMIVFWVPIMTHMMNRLSTLFYLQIVTRLLLKKPLVMKNE